MSFDPQQRVIDQLVHWGEQTEFVRAMILTSSRAIPHGHTDAFSDYDVILALTDIQRRRQARLNTTTRSNHSFLIRPRLRSFFGVMIWWQRNTSWTTRSSTIICCRSLSG